MNTYIIKSWTNFGEIIHIINAENVEELNSIIANDGTIWDNPEIEVIDTSKKGVVATGGGDGG